MRRKKQLPLSEKVVTSVTLVTGRSASGAAIFVCHQSQIFCHHFYHRLQTEMTAGKPHGYRVVTAVTTVTGKINKV